MLESRKMILELMERNRSKDKKAYYEAIELDLILLERLIRMLETYGIKVVRDK